MLYGCLPAPLLLGCIEMTKTSDSKVDWEARYIEQNTPWDRGAINPALATWIDDDCLPGGKLLVPGCGRGHEVLHMASLGWQVTAVDAAPSALAILDEALSQRGLSAELIQADLLQWRPAAPFDLIYEQTTLCALPPAVWSAYTRALADWLKPGGTLAALFMQTGREGGPPYHCDLAHMRELFSVTRWDWPKNPPMESIHPLDVKEYGVLLTRCANQN